ncbi:glutaredoxin family protein [Aeromicrobium sp. CTD01-1L150]|uniref:glutaredoxin family protein n=1 Tax=Aeromicrobium sp. CTD01-1L150 TaxID=3341830 RepID=UPI0035C15E7E
MIARRPKVPHARDARVVLFTRPGCHLCEQAEEVVADVCERTGDSWTTVDITGDRALVEAFTDQVPVTFVDGHQHDFWRVDATRLGAALTR